MLGHRNGQNSAVKLLKLPLKKELRGCKQLRLCLQMSWQNGVASSFQQLLPLYELYKLLYLFTFTYHRRLSKNELRTTMLFQVRSTPLYSTLQKV
jgi:hypothetical protein